MGPFMHGKCFVNPKKNESGSSHQMLLSSLVSFLNPLLQAASEDIPIVRRPDRKDLLGYLKVFLRLKPNFCHSGHVHCSGRSCLCSFH